MSTIALMLNQEATTALGENTRLRFKSLTRGGQTFLALRPSYRVAGRNAKIFVTKNEDGTSYAEIALQEIKDAGAPELVIDETYKFVDMGYGWFTMQTVTPESKHAAVVAEIKVITPVVAKAATDADQAGDTGETAEIAVTPTGEQVADEQPDSGPTTPIVDATNLFDELATPPATASDEQASA